VLLGALGVATILRLVPMAFNLLLLGGAAYIGWLGWSLMRHHAEGVEPNTSVPLSRSRTFGQGMLTCLLNPKAYLFTLAVLPQFLKPADGRIGMQLAALAAITAAAQIVVYGTVVVAGDKLRGWMQHHPGANERLMQSVGGVLILTALYGVYMGWREL